MWRFSIAVILDCKSKVVNIRRSWGLGVRRIVFGSNVNYAISKRNGVGGGGGVNQPLSR